jgi:hypothetical protein
MSIQGHARDVQIVNISALQCSYNLQMKSYKQTSYCYIFFFFASCHTQYNSVFFFFSLRAAFNCLKHFNLKTLNVHDMFQSIRPSSGVKIVDWGSCCSRFFRVHFPYLSALLWTIKQTNMEVAVLAFLWFISHICLLYCEQ